MSLLPKGIVKAESSDPRSMVIFSQPKVGKTKFCSSIPNSLLIDIEDGSTYVDAQKINVVKEAADASLKGEHVTPLQMLQRVITELRQANKEVGEYVYKVGIIDTATALEDLVLPMANKIYMDTPQGRNWQGTDVRTLPNGAGYLHTRKAFSVMINALKGCFEYFIVLGHLKEKMVGAEGEEMSVRALDLTGKVSAILCSQVDAVGYMYRDEEGDTAINFQPSEQLMSGSRCDHLKNQKVKVITSDSEGQLTVHYNRIFQNL